MKTETILLSEVDKKLEGFKKQEIYYRGNLGLLNKKRVTIVGSRRASYYAKKVAFELGRGFAKRGYAIISGGAMGVDIESQKGAGAQSSICVLGSGLGEQYPKTNLYFFKEIEKQGLMLSLYEDSFKGSRWSFVVRNRLMVALGEFLIVVEAEKDSGSMQSAKYALEIGKKIFVPSCRIYESEGTRALIKRNDASVFFDIEEFLGNFGKIESVENDSFFSFCKKSPSLEEAIKKFGERVFEAEIEGSIKIKQGRVFLTKE